MKSLSRLAALFVLSIVLIGCFGAEGKPTGTVEDGKFVSEDFSIEIPRDWEVVTDFPDEIKENTIVGIRNNVKDNQFVANINITYSPIQTEIAIKEFARQMLDTHRDSFLNFQEISSAPLQINVEGTPRETVLNIFEGKFRPELDTLHVIQTYGYKDKRAYLVTGMYALNEEQFAREKVEATVKSFEIR